MEFGDYRIEIVPEAEFRLDGGAMFGVVPRVLWERVAPPDESNRIRLKTNCLFVETGNERILIETGIGEKWTEKQIQVYGIEREKPFARALLEKTGYAPEQITIVVNTHLHFDHAGGNTRLDETDEIVPAFPNAKYFVSESEFKHAENPTERDRGSYVSDDWRLLQKSGQLELKEETYEIAPGFVMQTVPGHNASMQTLSIKSGDQTFYSFADLIPTSAHLPLAWIMGYDLYPLDTLANKKRLLPRALKEDWLCFFYHDPVAPLCRLYEENGKVKAIKVE